jgi:hypothetical protein
MPIWSKILAEINAAEAEAGEKATDVVRRKYLEELSRHTGRNTILYASKWSQPSIIPLNPDFISITPEDIQGLMEVINGLSGEALDLIIHSPGGSAEATESLVSYLRTKFTNIRVIIPHAAMSAATMLACSADKLVLGKHSFLGPIDPQMILETSFGLQAIPAQAILNQFWMIEEECKKDPEALPRYYPLIQQYGPALLMQCIQAQTLSEELVCRWLTLFMFKQRGSIDERKALAKTTAEKLADHDYFKSHGRFINREQARTEFGLEIEDLESDQTFQDLVLSVFHATTITFSNRSAVKIIENQKGNSFIKAVPPLKVLYPL